MELVESGYLSYVLIGHEYGKLLEKYHWQGYAELGKQTRFIALVKKLRNLGRVWRPKFRAGTQEEAMLYSMKDGEYEEFGKPKHQGSRGDLDAVREEAMDFGMRSVVSHGNMQQIRVAEKYLMYCEPARDWETEVIWIYGPSGSGKTRKAVKLAEEYDTYTVNPPANGSLWFDGYDGHECIIINEARSGWLSWEFLKDLTDRYTCRLPIKGGFRQCRARCIILTSVESPFYTYDDSNGELSRRLSRVIEIRDRKSGEVKAPTIEVLEDL